MGMFLSQYSMLKSLAYGEDRVIKHETEKILEQFKLFVLVLHDPLKHTSFHHKFSQLFERLDYLTGPNLLFMGIAKPNYDWYKRNENRDFFGIWEKDQLIRSFHEIKGGHGSMTCYSIAKALNIDYDDLPCLIISSNFASNHFVVLKTGEKHIESQLMELGIFASSVSEKRTFINSESFKSLLHNVDFYRQMEFVTQQEALGASLSDTISFFIPENNHFGRNAKEHSNSVIDKLSTKIKNTSDIDEIEKTKMNLLTSLANKFNNSKQSRIGMQFQSEIIKASELSEPTSGISKQKNTKLSVSERNKNNIADLLLRMKKYSNLFEQESNINISMTNSVSQLFTETNSEFIMDYSILALGFSKIFEIEINLSVIQWIRKHLNIEMPEYYKKYKPEFGNALITPDDTFVPNPTPVDFNRHKGTKWIPPGIGQSELVVRSLFKKKYLIETFSDLNEYVLLNAWKPIREMRNKAAHVEIMRLEDMIIITENFEKLLETNCLKKLLDLKLHYKGIGNETISEF